MMQKPAIAFQNAPDQIQIAAITCKKLADQRLIDKFHLSKTRDQQVKRCDRDLKNPNPLVPANKPLDPN
jgi:hypothetical protein